MRKLLTLTAGACAVLVMAAPVAAGEDEDQVVADEAVLTLADLPDGWEEDETPNEEIPTDTSECKKIQRADDKADNVPNAKSPQFDDPNDPNAVASVSNDVFVYPKVKGAKKHLVPFKRDGLECLESLAEEAGFPEYTVDELDIEDAGDDGIGFRIDITADNGFVTSVDLLIVRVGRAVATFDAEGGEGGLSGLPEAVGTVADRLEAAL
jgi:hypothetical protein